MAQSLQAPCLKPLAEPRHAPRMLRERLCQERVHSFPQIGSAFSARQLPVGHVAALRATSNPASPGVSVAGHRRSFSGSLKAPNLHRSPLEAFSVSSHPLASGNATTASDVAADVSGICKPEFAVELAAAVDVVERACHVCLAVREQMVAEGQGGYSSGSESEGGSSSVDKKDRSPVTLADFAVQALVALELAQQFPGVPLVGEEDASLLCAHLAGPTAPTPSPAAAQAVTGAAVGSATAAAAAASAAGTIAAGAAGGGEQGPCLAERVTDLVLRFASPHALALGGAGEGVEGSEGRAAAVEAVLGAIDAAAAATHDLDAATTAAPRHTRYWVLDPIDGTRGFLRGHHNQYAVGLALIEDGELVLSALGLPNMPLPHGTSSATQSNHAADMAGPAAAGEVDVESESGDDMWQRPRGVILAATKGGGAWMRRLHSSSQTSSTHSSNPSSSSSGSGGAEWVYERLYVGVGVRNMLACGTTHEHSADQTHPLRGTPWDGSAWDESSSSSSGHASLGFTGQSHSSISSGAVSAAHHGFHSTTVATSSTAATSSSSSSSSRRLCVCISDHEEWPSLPLARGLEAAAPNASHVTVLPLCCGSLCKYAAVALGYAAVFIQHPLPGSPHLKVWDHAAGVLCVTEAGGQVTDFAGQPLELGGEVGQADEEAARAATTHAPDQGCVDGSNGSLVYFSPHGGGVVATNGVLHAQVLHHLALGLRMRQKG